MLTPLQALLIDAGLAPALVRTTPAWAGTTHAGSPEAPVEITAAQVLARVGRLPPLPQAVLALQALLADDGTSVAHCASQIRQDAALVARLLRLANSAFYGVPGRVASVDDALHLIGLRSLRVLATTAAVTMQFVPAPQAGFSPEGYWRHSLATAFAAQGLAASLGLHEELAYTAGLLHDIGLLALAAHFPHALHACQGSPAEEVRMLGLDHTQIGEAIARHWHLPAAVTEVIAHHHDPAALAGEGACATLADVVHVADALAHALGYGHGALRRAPELDPGAWQRVRLHGREAAPLVERVHEAVAEASAALGLADGGSRSPNDKRGLP